MSPDDLQAGWRHFQADPHRIVAQRERHSPTARLAIDATFPPTLTEAIRAYGLDVLELGEIGTREEVLRRSSEFGRVLVTEYGATFKRLHRAHEGHADVLLVPTDAPLEEVARSVAKAVFAGEVSFGFVVKIDRPAGRVAFQGYVWGRLVSSAS